MKQGRIQSMLDPGSAAAALIHELGIWLYAGSGLVLVLVVALALYGAFSAPRKVAEKAWIVGGGIVFPAIVLAALLVYAIHVGHALSGPPARAADIEVVGKRWWWEVRYATGGGHAVLANELRIPVGKPLEIALSTDDVIHSFWVPALAGKVDMIPGRTNRIVVEAREPGIYRGQCAEFCGAQHAWMAFYVVALPEEEFRAWLARQAAPAAEPADAFLLRGRDAFLREACAACHTIRGTAAAGTLGPDLTHVGGRLSIGAGVLGSGAAALAAWIADPQHLKPGNLMPETKTLTGEDLRALASYLESLK
ncbi:MAG: cytochrome c oxidase subunit II [Pseudomonadota bacterium]